MPDISSLYPQPPQQNQQSNSLLSNPGQAIGLMQGLQNLQIQRQQMPDIIKRPGLENQQTGMSTRGMDIEQAKTYGNSAAEAFSGWLSGKAARGEKITDDDLHDAYANSASRLKPGHLQFPEVLHTMYEGARQSKDRAGYILNLQNSAQPATALTAPRTGTPDIHGQTTTTTSAGANVPGGVRTGNPLTSEDSAHALAADQVRMGNYQQEITPWENAHKALVDLGPGGTAPGAEGRVDFKAFLYGLAPSLVPEYQKKDIKNFEELRKNLAMGAQVQANNLPPHTNAGLTEAITGSPNIKITDMTNDQLIRYRIAMRKYEQAQMVAAEKEGGDVGYLSAKGRLANTLDPHAFGIERATPEELERIGKLKGKERDNFNRSLRAGYEAGVIKRPGQ